jgi:putative transposase
VRYLFIKEHRGEFCLERWCEAMEVSVSGYYVWRKRPPSERDRQNERLVEEIKAVHEGSEQSYGSPRVHTQLRAQGQACSQNRVARLMRINAISACRKMRFTPTTDSKHSLPVAHNELDRDFVARQADQKWVADITYVWTLQGWLYLAVVLDLFSRRVVGWAMEPTLERGLVVAALQMALLWRRPGPGLLHHSDRGSQYASHDYRQLLEERKISCSMSRKGNCWDNAPMESFFATLKQERVYRRNYQSRQQARQDIFHYIEVWYNRKRRHSSLGYLSPEEFEKQHPQTYQQQTSISTTNKGCLTDPI